MTTLMKMMIEKQILTKKYRAEDLVYGRVW